MSVNTPAGLLRVSPGHPPLGEKNDSFAGRASTMNVSKQTFDEQLPTILASIEAAEFIAVDLELTGLHRKFKRFIGEQDCYSAHRESAQEFMPLQVTSYVAECAQEHAVVRRSGSAVLIATRQTSG